MVNTIDLDGERIKRIESQNGRNSFASGGGPPHDSDMERRVSKLEDKMDSAQSTLNEIQITLARMEASISTKDDLSPIRADIVAIKTSLDAKATASSMAELKGRVDSLPGIAKISAAVALIGAILKFFPWIFNR
ncbi:hypothetical protein FKW31_03080 [Acetobacter sp. DmW_136]|uniref:hypothetical protein n=1 Tax=Acetobacter sp. DmW_136 TaxID=2591091 RepID=UPI001239F051|nr:hypothetical protein [Acetobacter sp. DmW_136]KAA8387643.1 hypothetical protein FKW31_03080 [Acetobacter sp. DmW_136]